MITVTLGRLICNNIAIARPNMHIKLTILNFDSFLIEGCPWAILLKGFLTGIL